MKKSSCIITKSLGSFKCHHGLVLAVASILVALLCGFSLQQTTLYCDRQRVSFDQWPTGSLGVTSFSATSWSSFPSQADQTIINAYALCVFTLEKLFLL